MRNTIVLISYVNSISCDTGGKCLAMASSNNNVLIVSGKPSEQFKVLGHTSKPNENMTKAFIRSPTALAGHAQSISAQVEASIITLCVAASETSDSHINHLLLFSLPSPIKG